MQVKNISEYLSGRDDKPLRFDTVNEALKYLYVMNFTFEQILCFDFLFEETEINDFYSNDLGVICAD